MLLERINEDWLKGMLKEKIGIFPAAFVNIKTDLPVPSKQPENENTFSKCEYQYYQIYNSLKFYVTTVLLCAQKLKHTYKNKTICCYYLSSIVY